MLNPSTADVAILTDPGGPVLAAASGATAARGTSCCDPHRPGRAGAGFCGADAAARPAVVAILTDPGGPVLAPPRASTASSPQGSCDPHRPGRAGAGGIIR